MLCDITTNSVVSLFALVLRSHYIAGLVQLFEDGILKAPFSLMMIIIMWLPDRCTPLVATPLPSCPFGPSYTVQGCGARPAGHRSAVVDETMTNENIFHIHNIDRRPA